MTDYLLAGVTPTGSFSDGAPGITLGTWIRADDGGPASVGAWYFPTTLPSQPVRYLLWSYNPATDSPIDLLVDTVFADPDPNAWNYVTFDPIELDVGGHYVAAVWTPDWYVARPNYFVGDKPGQGGLVGPDDAPGERRNGRFAVGASPTFPTSGTASAACYFPDLGINAAVLESAPWSPVTIQLSPQQLSPTPGEVSAPWSPVSMQLSASSLIVTPGPVSAPWSPVTLQLIARAPSFNTDRPGTHTPGGTSATLTASGTSSTLTASQL